ncbi:hypothetical protein [Martelella sp. AMO21009]
MSRAKSVHAAAIVGMLLSSSTWNLEVCPARHLLPQAVTSQSPDNFLIDLHAAFPDALISSVKRARYNLHRTAPSIEAFVDTLQQGGLNRFSHVLHRNIALLN